MAAKGQSRPCIAALLILLALGTGVSVARADDRSDALELAHEGLALFEQGNWAAAYSKFAAANRLHQAPTLLLYMARCDRNQGQLLEARSLYEDVMREPLAPDASLPFIAARASAQTELDEVERRIPFVRIVIHPPATPAVELRVDGTLVPAAQRHEPVALNPGVHLVTVSAPGFLPAFRTVELADIATVTTVRLELEPVAAVTADDRRLPPDESSQGPVWAAGLAFGVAGASLVIGSITGALALSKTEDIKSRCQGNRCLVADEDEIESARSLAGVSTVAFVVAGAGVAAGTIALFAGGGASSSEDSDVAVRLELGPGRVGLAGCF